MTYAQNAWHVAAWSRDLTDAPFAITILNQPLAIFRTTGGVAALEDRCVHRLAPLSRGRCEGDHLRCMYHGVKFDAFGTVVEIPGQEMIPQNAKVRSFPVVDRHDWIWVWMGDPARADPALIPPAVGLSDPDWVLGHGQMDYAAEARLICDNLCDFSHLSFVHANSFGATEDWAKSRPTVIPLGRGVRFERWMEGQPRMAGRGEGLADVWQWYDFLVPGVLLMSSVALPEGSAKKHGFKAPAPDRALEGEGITFTSQAVTPITDKTSRYFFSWGPRKDQDGEGKPMNRDDYERDLTAEVLEANGCGGFFPIMTGEVQELRQFIFYTIRDGKIAQTECAMLPPEESVVQVSAK